MKSCIKIYVLIFLFFGMVGSSKATKTNARIKSDTTINVDVHFQFDNGNSDFDCEGNRLMIAKLDSVLRNPLDYQLGRKIVEDSGMPDKEDVLALINYHKNNPERLQKLLRYLNGGKPYCYIVNVIIPQLKPVDVAVEIVTPKWEIDEEQPWRLSEIETAPVIEENKTEKVEYKTVLALKNNMLYDLAFAPNIEIELPIGRRWSLNTEYKCPWWLNNSRDFCYQLLSGGVEARCWLGNRKKRHRLTGHFIGLYAEGGIYDFQFGGEGYQGKYYGASGVTYGYVKQIARHFALEFSFGIGYLATKYRKYTPYEGDLIWASSGRTNFIGPTKAKVSLVWLITTRR